MSIPMNKTCTIESYTVTNTDGIQKKVWSFFGSTKCLYTQLNENQSLAYSTDNYKATHKFYFNNTTIAVKEGMRIKVDGWIFYIVSVNNVQMRNHHLEIITSRETNV